MTNYRKRVDLNQTRVVEILRKRGFQVIHTYMMGEGFPDLVVSKNGAMCLVEVKDGLKAKLTPPQEIFFDKWQGPKIWVIRTDKDALEFDF